MTSLAHHIQARNHEVVFLYSATANGLPSISGPKTNQFNESISELAKLEGQDAAILAMRALMLETEGILKTLPEMIQASRVEALLIDPARFYAELGAMHLGLPYIHVSNAMHLDFTGYTPFPLSGCAHSTTPEALARNRQAIEDFVEKLQKTNSGIRAYAASVGLEIDWQDPGSTLSPWGAITQVPKAFDFESSHWPPQFHHTGPFIDRQFRAKVDFPWERLTGQPIIYASMGTILNGRIDVFRTISSALAKHKDLQLVLSIGDQLEPEQIQPAPRNAVIVKRAPQLDLLKRATACITHAGLNTVLESLAEGVPQVAIPVTFDQPGVAARIAEKRTGVVTSLDHLSADHLSSMLSEVLHNPTYRDNASKLQKAIAKANGLTVAADLIERSLDCRE